MQLQQPFGQLKQTLVAEQWERLRVDLIYPAWLITERAGGPALQLSFWKCWVIGGGGELVADEDEAIVAAALADAANPFPKVYLGSVRHSMFWLAARLGELWLCSPCLHVYTETCGMQGNMLLAVHDCCRNMPFVHVQYFV
jgi:hypothetical protein